MNVKHSSRKTGLRQKAQLMSASEIERTLVRLAYEIVEKNGGVDGLGLVGIRRRGVPIAERLGKIITRIENAQVPVGTLDITFYRDDLSQVQLCVLIDRGHRELPVEASFVGRNIQTTMNEVIEVKLTEIDDAEKVLLMEK